MIRRDIRLENGDEAWMLISQIEHARISAQLAAACAVPLAADFAVHREILDAIALHDDGWARWECEPRLDPALGRPLSFMELETDEALDVWGRSIHVAQRRGPLAAWMVAGHFSRLLDHADSLHKKPSAVAWLTETARRRSAWLAEWRLADTDTHTVALAETALMWLWTFDEASLWFCCEGPSGNVPQASTPSAAIGRGTPLEMEFHAKAASNCAETPPRDPADPRRATATAIPWRFDVPTIDVDAVGQIVPSRKYGSSQELLDAGTPGSLHWRFRVEG